MFLHRSIIHILFNMYALFALGPGLESSYGHGRFLGLYLLSRLCRERHLFLVLGEPFPGLIHRHLGLIGAEAVFLYRNRRILGCMAQRALGDLISAVVINLVLGGASTGIEGHIGGLLGGVFAWFAGRLLPDGRRQPRPAHRR